MHRFYVDGVCEADRQVKITGEDVNHILNVLRLGINDEITVSDGSSRDFLCRITEINNQGNAFVLANIIDIYDNNSELPADIFLFQGVPKGDKMELIIQKCVELGCHSIIPVMMERTIVKLDEKKKSKKTARYNSISEAAAKQSRRGIIPEVTDYMMMKDALEYARANLDIILFPYEFAEGMDESRQIILDCVKKVKQSLELKKEKLRIGIFIGPEGGFADSEAKALQEIGARTMSLGHRILRTETAGMTVMSILSFWLDI